MICPDCGNEFERTRGIYCEPCQKKRWRDYKNKRCGLSERNTGYCVDCGDILEYDGHFRVRHKKCVENAKKKKLVGCESKRGKVKKKVLRGIDHLWDGKKLNDHIDENKFRRCKQCKGEYITTNGDDGLCPFCSGHRGMSMVSTFKNATRVG